MNIVDEVLDELEVEIDNIICKGGKKK